MKKIAIVGASGFIGLRLVECLHLSGYAEIIPVVRNYSSLAVLARLELDWKVCNHFDPNRLSRAFSGCDTVVHAAIGDSQQIIKMASAIYQGAQLAGVRRMIVLSSAAVYGQSIPEGIFEESPFPKRQLGEYGNAKAKAEKALRRLRLHGKVEIVFLRPSIVYGPRCRWVAQVADELLANAAYLVNGGSGICNCVYVDNLIQAIERAIEIPEADKEAFFVTDKEKITWKEFYEPIVDALGFNMEAVLKISPPIFKHSFSEKIKKMIAAKPIQAAAHFLPGSFKKTIKAVINSRIESVTANAWALPGKVNFRPSEEMCLLEQSTYKLPILKAEKILKYQPDVTFSEGMRRSIGWLSFAGYPILDLNNKLKSK
ncbi:MAG: NAD(P)-dependent oxidoreductase [Candidatus Omnitrophota bacterium]